MLILSYVDTALTCVWLFLTRGNFEANILKVLRTLSGPDTEAIKVNAETISTLNFHFIYIHVGIHEPNEEKIALALLQSIFSVMTLFL